MSYLAVGDGHEIYYSVHGNSAGPTVLFLHGGPGLGCTSNDLRFFNLTHYQVLLLDQRGAGQSRPTGSLEHNTTAHLLSDITKLLDHLELKQVIAFGGSWGATLALLYAIACPTRVSHLVLRGIFSGTIRMRDYMEKGAVADYFPEAWARYRSQASEVPEAEVATYYYQKLLSDQPEERTHFAFEMLYFGMQLAFLNSLPAETIRERILATDYVNKARIQSYYSHHRFFIPEDFILQELYRIQHIPIYILQGRYDVVCPPYFAYELSQKHPLAKLKMLTAGHVASEVEVELIETMRELEHD